MMAAFLVAGASHGKANSAALLVAALVAIGAVAATHAALRRRAVG